MRTLRTQQQHIGNQFFYLCLGLTANGFLDGFGYPLTPVIRHRDRFAKGQEAALGAGYKGIEQTPWQRRHKVFPDLTDKIHLLQCLHQPAVQDIAPLDGVIPPVVRAHQAEWCAMRTNP